MSPLFLQTHRNFRGESLPHCGLLPKTGCNVLGRSWRTALACAVSLAEDILNIFEIGYEINISLNCSFKFRGIIIILFTTKPVQFH